jgi:hypothetical protein
MRIQKMKMDMKPDEEAAIELCLLSLPETEIARCHDKALQLAAAALENDDYADLLVKTAVAFVIRNVRQIRLGSLLQEKQSDHRRRTG